MVVELLQQIGLNKYEAEAYAALLQHGPLTGYELGKRSGVPLSRSYEILERLASKGLALVQPGDPARYAAEAADQLIERTRTTTTATLDALAGALAELGSAALPEGFWVVRGQPHILTQANALLGKARRTLAVAVAPAHSAALAEPLSQARTRGCRVVQPPIATGADAAATLLILVDNREAMVGTLTPADRAQAVVSANPGFVGALVRCCEPQLVFNSVSGADLAASAREGQPLEWLDWEQRKQRRLLNIQPPNPRA